MRVSKNQVTLLSAAIAGLFAASANAAVNLNATTPTGANLFASEAIIAATGTAINTAPVAGLFNIGAAAGLSTYAASQNQAQLDAVAGVPLGVGIAQGQKRFIRLDLSGGARFGAGLATDATGLNIVATNGTGAAVSGQFSAVAIALGGVGSSFVVYEVTGATGTGSSHLQSDIVQVLIPAITATATSATAITYSIYEFLTNANASSGAVFTRTAPLVTFAPSVRNVVNANGSTTVAATTGFRTTAAGATRFSLGSLNIQQTLAYAGFSSTQPRLLTGTVIAAVADVVASAGNVLTVTGDFSAAAAPASVYTINNASATCTPNTTTGVLAIDSATAVTATSATIPLATATFAGSYTGTGIPRVCYQVNGTSAVLASNYAASFALVGQTGYNNLTLGTGFLGEIVRDGATYESPWVTVTPGFISRIFLTSSAATALPWTATVRNAAGAVTGGTLSGSLAPNQLTQLSIASLLPADTTAFPGPYAVSITVGGTVGLVTGSYVLTSPNGSVATTPLYRASAR
jgi:hypothetical protein